MKSFKKKSSNKLAITIAAALGSSIIASSVFADGLIRDDRIRPATLIEITSSNTELNTSLANSIEFVYDYLVVGPNQYPTTETEPRIVNTREAGVPAVPSYWGSYHGTPSPVAQGYRENFCIRDVSHQMEGASVLSLNEENFYMLQQFAYDSLQDARVSAGAQDFNPLDPWASARTKSFWQEYWTLWSSDFYGMPYYMDAGFQELPAPLELLEKIYTMYEYSGDPRWLNDTFMAYGKQLHEQFIPRYDFNGNGVVDNRGSGILPTLWEFEGASNIQESELDFTLNADGVTGTLTIKKEYFARISVQDISLKVRFRNGKDDYINVRVNNLVNAEGAAPVLSRDYVFRENTIIATDVPVSFNVPNGVTLTSLTDGATVLTEGTEYTLAGNTVTISGAYIENLQNTRSQRYKSSFGFNFSNGTTERMVVESNDRGYVKDILSSKDEVLDWNNLQDINLTLDFSQTPSENRNLYRIENQMNRVAEAGDTLGVQYQATLAYEGMLRAKATFAESEVEQSQLIIEADVYKAKAENLLNQFRTEWYNEETQTYARAFDAYGNAIYGWGHENSFFMPMKELLEPGQKADDYLQFIHDNSENLNEEAKTYLPEAFYNYGQNAKGWYWMQTGLERFTSDRTQEQQIKTYPEIAFTNVSNTVTYMMGYDPKIHNNTVETLSRLPRTIGFLEAKNLPVGQSLMDTSDYVRNIEKMVTLKHEGQYTSTLTNQSGSNGSIAWVAQFEGTHNTLSVDGSDMAASQKVINGVTVSYVNIDVAVGQSVVVTTGLITEKLADDWPLEESNNNGGGNSTPTNPTAPVIPQVGFSLMNLTPISASTGFGTIGEDVTVENKPITINGSSYERGIGAHSHSEITYVLNGEYTRFTAVAGVDDEVSERGSIAFQVYLDGTLAYDSGVVTGSSPEANVNIDVTGATEMTLVATDGGDGISNDHADWGNPTLTLVPVAEISDTSIVDLTPIVNRTAWGETQFDTSLDGNPISIGGTTFERGIGTHALGQLVYAIDGAYNNFSATVGVDGEVGTNGSVIFQVIADGVVAFDSGVVVGGQSTDISVDIQGANELMLLVTDAGDGMSWDHASWGNPVLSTNSGYALSDLTATSIVSGWGSTQFDKSIIGNTITIGGETFEKGLGTHSAGEMVYALDGEYKRFTATVGVDDAVGDNGSIGFQVYLDGVLAFDSGVLTGADSGQAIDLDVTDVTEIKLVSTDGGDGGDGISNDHASWGNPRLVK